MDLLGQVVDFILAYQEKQYLQIVQMDLDGMVVNGLYQAMVLRTRQWFPVVMVLLGHP